MFHFAYKGDDKRDAQRYAKRMRQKGHKARVIKQKGRWIVIRDKY